MRYRLGLDIGTNSIGWCAIRLEDDGTPAGILDAGVRILTPNDEAGRDPQSKASLAASRRFARSARRRRDRFVRRQKRLMEILIGAGLMPAREAERKKLEKQDPYWLRAAALDRRLDPHQIGRAIFHLNQRRGFKSNRIADSDDDEKSSMKSGMRALEGKLEEAGGPRTLGEYLARRHGRDGEGYRVDRLGRRIGASHDNPQPDTAPQGVRFRPQSKGSKNLYEVYPTRQMIETELDALWTAQRPHHRILTEPLLASLKRVIVEQRDLKKPIVGRCSLRPDAQIFQRYGLQVDHGERAPKAHPLFQRFRILQDLSQLRVVRPGRAERAITVPERDLCAAHLMSLGGTKIGFEKLRTAIKLPDDARFNYELSGRQGLQPDQTGAKLSARKAFGKSWRSLPRERQIEVVEKLLAVQSDEKIVDWLMQAHGLSHEAAEAVSEMRLPQGHGQFGRSVLADLVTAMEEETKEDCDRNTGEIFRRPLIYSEAVERIGLHHSDHGGDGKAARLPYYGEAMARHVISNPEAAPGTQERIGRVPNPTVHIGLNQLRKLVNALIEAYGKPAEIVVELARELKLSQKRKDELQRENRENEAKNEDRRARLASLGQTDTHDARLRLRLFDEMPADEKVCVFSGRPLDCGMLFNGSVEVEHVLPYSRTLDDSFMNKVLCTREANRRKGNRIPGECWSGEDLQEIFERAERLFPRKAWRFQPDAMASFESRGDFLSRQLTDTQHVSRLAKSYLEEVCDQVWAPPGRLTAMLRARWGLNGLLSDHNFADVGAPKNRRDHRHHAIDGFVIACTDRGLLQRMARASGRAEDLGLERLFPSGEFPEPYDGYRADLASRLETLVVSHKSDHGVAPGAQGDVHVTSGQLLEATAYGLVDEEVDGKRYNLVTRKPIAGLTAAEIGRVRDRGLRAELQHLATEAKRKGEKLDAMLAAFGEQRGVRRVRVLKTEQSIRIVSHGERFKKAYAPGDNHRIEIYETPSGRWAGEGVTVFDANQPGFVPRWRKESPDAKFVMSLHNGDLVAADFGEGALVYRVCRLEAGNNRVRLAAHYEAGSLGNRHADPDDRFRYEMKSYSRLQAAGAERLKVDPIGRVAPLRRPQ